MIDKKTVEALLRERGIPDDKKILWRDNRASTYKQVYDYLMKYPELRMTDIPGIWE